MMVHPGWGITLITVTITTEFTSVRDERVKILVNSCIIKMDRIGIRSRKSCAARPREGEACS